MKMNISEATEHLARILRDHLLAKSPKDSAIRFLDALRRIGEFRNQGNLDAWETAVLAVFTNNEWEEFEKRSDFGVLESVWEVGRLNMYGEIDSKATRESYEQAAKEVRDHTGTSPLNVDRFDFSQW